jgi:hypothetical protein
LEIHLRISHNIEYDIQPGSALTAGLGAEIRYDDKVPETVEEHFNTQTEPGDEIFNHFTERRGNYHSIDEQGISTDEDGNPHFSELVEEEIGECLEMALAGLSFVQDDKEEVYLVNGSLPDIDQLNYKVPEHAYLILEDNEGYEIFDPAKLLNSEPVRGRIVGVGESNTLELEEEVQEEFESAFGQKYSIQ